jgi:hypothetical protein
MSKKMIVVAFLTLGSLIAVTSLFDNWDGLYKCPDCGKIIYPGTSHKCK